MRQERLICLSELLSLIFTSFRILKKTKTKCKRFHKSIYLLENIPKKSENLNEFYCFMRKLSLGILSIIFLIIPFHPFLVTWLNSAFFDPSTAPSVFLSAWKEALIAILAIIFIIQVIRGKIKIEMDFLDVLIISFFLWSLVTGILWTNGGVFKESGFDKTSFLQVVYGAKYSFAFLLLFFIVRHMNFTADEKNILIYLALTSASVVIIFAVIQKFLPEDFLLRFGYSDAGPKAVTQSLAYCQKTPLTDAIDICRAQSTLSGPNHLGAYLVFILPLIFAVGINLKESLFKIVHFFMIGLGLFVLYWSYSRGAWLGLIGTSFLSFAFIFRKEKEFMNFSEILALCGVFGVIMATIFAKPEVLAEGAGKFHGILFTLLHAKLFYLIIFLVSSFFVAFASWKKLPLISYFVGLFDLGIFGIFLISKLKGEWFWQVLLRPSSTQGHWERTADGVYYLKENPLGLGLGDAGPASNHFAPDNLGFIPENAFLQVGLESGYIGMAIFVLIIIFTAYKLFKSNNNSALALGTGLIGLVIHSLFLHTWESSVVALTFWGLAGVMLAKEKKLSFLQKISHAFQKFFLFFKRKF